MVPPPKDLSDCIILISCYAHAAVHLGTTVSSRSVISVYAPINLSESHVAAVQAKPKASGRKRKQVVMSDSDESGNEESAPDSGSDWSEASKEAAPDGDDDVSMADDSDESTGSGSAFKKGARNSKRQKSSPSKVP